MSDKQTVQDLKETLIALTDTFEFLKEQDPKDLKKNKIQIFQVADVELQESRARRVSGSAGVRVAKGVYLQVIPFDV